MVQTEEAPCAGAAGLRFTGPAVLLAFLLSACATVTPTPDETPRPDQPAVTLTERPTDLTREMLIGRWGVASFRDEKDRARVTAQARSFCARQPYVITAGPRNGVMMHAADDAKLYELRLKGGSDGKTYLGFEAPPGDWQDRVILSASNDQWVMRFVDPEVHSRYGTFIYVRCK